MDFVIARQLLRAWDSGDHYMFLFPRETSKHQLQHALHGSLSLTALAIRQALWQHPLRGAIWTMGRPGLLNYGKQESRGEPKENPAV